MGPTRFERVTSRLSAVLNLAKLRARSAHCIADPIYNCFPAEGTPPDGRGGAPHRGSCGLRTLAR